jgi:hypothetical protein
MGGGRSSLLRSGRLAVLAFIYSVLLFFCRCVSDIVFHIFTILIMPIQYPHNISWKRKGKEVIVTGVRIHRAC